MLGSLAGRVDYPHAGVDVGVTHVLVQVPENSLFLASLLGVGPRPVTLQLLCTQVLGQWPQCPDPAIVEEMAADVVVALFPVGIGASAWDVWLCARSDASRSGDFRRRCVAHWRKERDVVGEFVQALGNSDEALRMRARLAEQLGTPVDELGIELLMRRLQGDCDHHNRSYLSAFSGMASLDYAGAAERLWVFGEDDNLPAPLIRLGRTDRLSLPLIEELSIDTIALTRGWLLEEAVRQRSAMGLEPRWVEGTEEMEDDFDFFVGAPWTPTGPGTVFGRNLEAMVGRVNDTYQELLLDAPRLDLAVGEYVDWMAGEPFWWEADGHRLDRLSRAEQRWAKIAIAHGLSGEPTSLLIDEPEAALHRSAEAHMAQGLAQLAAQGNTVITATHTPALLDENRARLLECRKIQGRGSIRSLGPLELQRLADLGLRPSDLLEGIRVFVLVEGVHDQQILNHLLAAQLQASSARLLPIHGGRNLGSAIDGPFILDYTQAAVVAVLDHQNAERLQLRRSECEQLAATDGLGAVESLLNQAKRSPTATEESKFVADFILAGLERGVMDRLHLYGLEQGDITWYFPPAAFMPTDKSWTELLNEHTKANGKRTGFKGFLKNSRGANFSPEIIDRALANLEHVPEDIVALGNYLQQMADRR